jgi:hypothetical protein
LLLRCSIKGPTDTGDREILITSGKREIQAVGCCFSLVFSDKSADAREEFKKLISQN